MTAVGGARLRASPLARRIAAAEGIDLTRLRGGGPGGRIVKADVLAAKAAPAPAAAASPPVPPTPAPPAPVPPKPETDAPASAMRRTIARRLTEAKRDVPHFYLRRDARIDRLLALRAEINGGDDANISVNDLVVKACGAALARHPDCNAIWTGDGLRRFAQADVAVAVAVDDGLYTPVARDVAGRTLSSLSGALADLAARARAGRLAPEEYVGGAMAVSNLGMFGVESFDAVINPPQSSILAVGAGTRRPVVEGDALGVATVMSLTLSVDHRAVDGAAGAAFLGAIVEGLENPARLLV